MVGAPEDLHLASVKTGALTASLRDGDAKRAERRPGGLRAGADKTAQPTGRFSHQVHGPSVRSQGKEHVITHILVIIHLSLEKEADR